MWNLLLRVHINNLWLNRFLKCFEPFGIFYRNLWNGSQVSIYVSRVKIAEETVFWFFFSEFFFRILSENFFRLSAKNLQKSCQNYLLRDQRNNLLVEIFFKSFESFWIFCRNLWHGSQVSIYVSRVKFAEEKVFFSFFLSEFFRILSENFFRLLAEKRQDVVKTTFYASRGTICGLKCILKVLNRFGFSAETFGMVLKFLNTCPEKKIAEETVFWFFFSEFFFGFSAKIFSDFRRKIFKKFSKVPSAWPEEQFVAWNIFLKF